jgi:NitT/TauT family transport system substrate-binding protein
VFGKVEMAFMDNQDQPVPLMRGDVGAICVFEPYAALAELNGWGKKLWVPYDSPMGKTNLGFVASEKFVKADPELTKKMVKAHVAATKEMASNSAIAIETTIKQFKMTKEVAELSVKNLFFSADSGAPFVSGLKALAKMMIDDKLLEKEPDWGSFLNLGYV